MSWGEHITYLAISANKLLDIFNIFKYKLDRRSLEKLYFTYVRSKLEYASIVWDNCPKYLVDMLENVQFRAAKIISGATNQTSTALIYRELGCEKRQERGQSQRLTTMYKITHGETPQYLESDLNYLEAPGHAYELRNADAIPLVRTRTSAFQNSFYPRTVGEWNELDDWIEASSLFIIIQSEA